MDRETVFTSVTVVTSATVAQGERKMDREELSVPTGQMCQELRLPGLEAQAESQAFGSSSHGSESDHQGMWVQDTRVQGAGGTAGLGGRGAKIRRAER